MKKLSIVLGLLAMAVFLLGGCATTDYRGPDLNDIYVGGPDGGSSGSAAGSTGGSTGGSTAGSTAGSLAYAAFCSVISLAFYFTIALFYPCNLYYPFNFVAIILAFIYLPLYLSTEVFYRKILYPASGFLKSKNTRTFIISVMTGFTQLILGLMFFPWLIPVMIASMIAFIGTSLMNGIIYHKTENLGATFLNFFIIMSIFYGAVWSYFLNLLSMTI